MIALLAAEADRAHSATSDDSFTTDDEESAAISGNQTWTMSFEWQDGTADNTSDSFTNFEDSTDFGQPPLQLTDHQTNITRTDSSLEAAEEAPADPAYDWILPWSADPAGAAAPSNQAWPKSKTSQPSAEHHSPPRSEPMSDEHKTAILGGTACHAHCDDLVSISALHVQCSQTLILSSRWHIIFASMTVRSVQTSCLPVIDQCTFSH